jgi:hypothetical protein
MPAVGKTPRAALTRALLVGVCLWLMPASPVIAHGSRPAYLELKEIALGR